jgi:hypothetical protein
VHIEELHRYNTMSGIRHKPGCAKGCVPVTPGMQLSHDAARNVAQGLFDPHQPDTGVFCAYGSPVATSLSPPTVPPRPHYQVLQTAWVAVAPALNALMLFAMSRLAAPHLVACAPPSLAGACTLTHQAMYTRGAGGGVSLTHAILAGTLLLMPTIVTSALLAFYVMFVVWHCVSPTGALCLPMWALLIPRVSKR